MRQMESQVRREFDRRLIPLPGVQAGCVHTSIAKEIHCPGSEGLTQAFPAVAWESCRRAKITPIGVEVPVVLPVRAGYNGSHKLPITSGNVYPIGAEIGILGLPLGQNPGPESLSGVGGVCQLYECLLLILL